MECGLLPFISTATFLGLHIRKAKRSVHEMCYAGVVGKLTMPVHLVREWVFWMCKAIWKLNRFENILFANLSRTVNINGSFYLQWCSCGTFPSTLHKFGGSFRTRLSKIGRESVWGKLVCNSILDKHNLYRLFRYVYAADKYCTRYLGVPEKRSLSLWAAPTVA